MNFRSIWILTVVLTLSVSLHAQDSQDTQDAPEADAEATPVPEAPYPGASEEVTEPPALSVQQPTEGTTPVKRDTKFKRYKPRPQPFRMTDAGTFYPRFSSPQTRAASLRLGSYGAPSLHTVVAGKDRYFADIYKSSGIMLLFDWEWQILRGFGKLGIKIGSGIYSASGKGLFKDGTQARETYNFMMFPNNASVVYRLQYKDRQVIVPYLEGGAGYFTFAELRSDGQKNRFGAAPVGVGAAGFGFLLDKIDPATMAELDVENGINHIYLTAELRAFVGLNKDFDFTSTMINGGFTFEF